MLVHTIFDLLAWTSAGLLGWWIGRQGWLKGSVQRRTPLNEPFYFITLAFGGLAGAILFGSLNQGLAGFPAPGHSIAGALIGGIAAVEIYKAFRGIRSSTGLAFAGPLALGIAIGRIGCFLSGLPDYTYGIPTTLPWGVDFGDGIKRHPVQLYESLMMLIFLGLYLRGIAQRSALFRRHGFYLLVGWYGAQRFVWEFLKPYPKLFGPFNLFHFLCLAMVLYALVMIGINREPRPQR